MSLSRRHIWTRGRAHGGSVHRRDSRLLDPRTHRGNQISSADHDVWQGHYNLQAFKKVFQEAGIRATIEDSAAPLAARSRSLASSSRCTNDSSSRWLDREPHNHNAVGSGAGAQPSNVAGRSCRKHRRRYRRRSHHAARRRQDTHHAAHQASGSCNSGVESSATAAMADALPRGVNTSIIPTLLHIGRTEGVKTLFSGFVPRTMWIGLGGAVFLGTFDAGIKALS